MILNV